MASATFLSATSFSVAGDMTGQYAPGVRVRADCQEDGYRYGTVRSSVFADPVTLVVIWEGEGAFTENLASALHGNDAPESLCAHHGLHCAGQRDAIAPGDIEALGLDEEGLGASQLSRNASLGPLAWQSAVAGRQVIVQEFADDAAAAAGGVPVGGLYRVGSTLTVRLS